MCGLDGADLKECAGVEDAVIERIVEQTVNAGE